MASLAPWHDVYMLLGQASATMTGLLFVAASVRTGVYSQNRPGALRMFLTGSVVQFICVLITCLLAIAPLNLEDQLGFAIAACGVFGLLYTARAFRDAVHDGIFAKLDTEDRIWYAAGPAFAYLAECAAGLALRQGVQGAACLLAVTAAVLLAVAIRNAWDITLWTVTRTRE